MPKNVSREQFDFVLEILWKEIVYQNELPRRTDDEAKDVPSFLTLGRRYQRKTEDAWSDNPGQGNPPQVPEALDGMRSLAAIYIRALVYCGIRTRQ